MMHNLRVHCHIFRGVEQTLSIGFISHMLYYLNQPLDMNSFAHCRTLTLSFSLLLIACSCRCASHQEYQLTKKPKNLIWLLWCATMIIIRYSLFIVDIVIITEICVTTLFWFHGGINSWYSAHVWHANAHKWLVKSKTMPINMMNSVHTESGVSCWFSSVFGNVGNCIRRIQLTNVRKCVLIAVMQWNTPHSPRISCKQPCNIQHIWM